MDPGYSSYKRGRRFVLSIAIDRLNTGRPLSSLALPNSTISMSPASLFLLVELFCRVLNEEKYAVMEDMARDVTEELQRQEVTSAEGQDLERHAYSVNDSIRNPNLRNLHILAAV